MSRPKVHGDRTNVTIRLTNPVRDALVAAAEERDVSATWLAERAIADYLSRLIPVDELRLTRDA